MAKRIVTKIGDVFCAEIDNTFKRYFQYVIDDLSCLNGRVIRVFKTSYPIDENPDIEDVVHDEVDFYVHTIIKFGIEDGVWCKVGKSKYLGNPSEIMFASPADLSSMPKKSYQWYAWKVNQEPVFIGEKKGIYQKADMGGILHYSNVIHRIKTGRYIQYNIE